MRGTEYFRWGVEFWIPFIAHFLHIRRFVSFAIVFRSSAVDIAKLRILERVTEAVLGHSGGVKNPIVWILP